MRFKSGILFIVVAASIFASCRMRRDGSDTLSDSSSARMKLFATCVSESASARYNNIIVQEDTVDLKGLLTFDSGSETQHSKTANLVVENPTNADARKTYTSKDLTFAIDLSEKHNDTYSARLRESKDAVDSVYQCAI